MDYFSHPKDGFDETGLPLSDGCPLKFAGQFTCDRCGAELTDANKVKYCVGCGDDGCQKCLKVQDNNYEYLCEDLKCLDKYYAKFKNILDDVVDKLHRFIFNMPQDEKNVND